MRWRLTEKISFSAVKNTLGGLNEGFKEINSRLNAIKNTLFNQKTLIAYFKFKIKKDNKILPYYQMIMIKTTTSLVVI
ncbi:hypothetical protein AU253_02285 [Yersinia pestis]|nr:hypothetical protein AU253_02285 [Yersinia pestis]